jgi:hypothetical protein
MVDVTGIEPATPCLQSVNRGHCHCLSWRATKRDWANDSAGFRARGQCARLLLSDADSCQGVHQIVHQNEGAELSVLEQWRGGDKPSSAASTFLFFGFGGEVSRGISVFRLSDVELNKTSLRLRAFA